MTDTEWEALLQVMERYKAARVEWLEYSDGRQARLDQQAALIHRQDEQIEQQGALITWQDGRIRELEALLRGQILNAPVQ